MLSRNRKFALRWISMFSLGTILFLAGCDLFNLPEQGLEGTIKWQWNAESSVSGIGYTTSVGPDENIYVVAGSPIKLYAISPSGDKLWESQEMDFSPYSTTEQAMNYPVIASNGTIYVMGYYKLYAFYSDGTLKWSWTTPESGDPYPHSQIFDATLGQDGTIYFTYCGAGAYHRFLFALNPDGTIKWAKDLADPYIGNGIKNLTVGKDGVLYGQTGNGANYSVYAFDPDNGAILWSLELGYDVNTQGFGIGSDGTIYIASYENGGRLFAVSPNGSILWNYDGLSSPSIPTVGSDGTIYVVDANGYVDGDLYALTSNGTLKWHKGNTWGSNIAIASDGSIYGTLIFDDTTNFAAVNSDGSARWTLNIGGINNGSPSIGSDGTIYVTHGGTPPGVTAIYGSAALASSSWPRARGGNRNTGAYRE